MTRVVTLVAGAVALGAALGAAGCSRGENEQTSYGRWEYSTPTDQPASAPGMRDDPERTNRIGTLDPELSGGEPSPFARPGMDAEEPVEPTVE